MSRITALHRARHASVQLRHPLGTAKLRFALLGRSELTLASADFPICLAKEAATGRFNLIALLSLIEPRNLFWLNEKWHATYLPEATTTAPFFLDPDSEHGVAVDEDSVTLNAGGMQPGWMQLFGSDGKPTETLKNISARLKRITNDIADAQGMVDEFARRKLIRPLQLVLRLDDGREHQIEGLYSLGTEALATLSDDSVVTLYRSGNLAAAAIMSASLSQIERLRQLHNASGAKPITSARVGIAE
jgi:hypothetical protein